MSPFKRDEPTVRESEHSLSTNIMAYARIYRIKRVMRPCVEAVLEHT